MGTQRAQRYCPTENRIVLSERETPNHAIHALLSVITVGIWLPVWLLIALLSGKPWLCPTCGSKTRYPSGSDHRRAASNSTTPIGSGHGPSHQ